MHLVVQFGESPDVVGEPPYNLTAALLGRMAGSVTGEWLWECQIRGMALHACLGAALLLGAFVVMALGVSEVGDSVVS